MTAHYGSDPSDNSRWWYWSQLEYPVTENGIPNVWVSQGKHANYPTESKCDAGGFFFSDFCDRDVTEAVGILRGRNLGELNAKLVNCTFSAIPSQHPGQECFWTEQYFDGWWGGFTDYTAGYGGHLGQFMSQPNGWDTSVLRDSEELSILIETVGTPIPCSFWMLSPYVCRREPHLCQLQGAAFHCRKYYGRRKSYCFGSCNCRGFAYRKNRDAVGFEPHLCVFG